MVRTCDQKVVGSNPKTAIGPTEVPLSKDTVPTVFCLLLHFVHELNKLVLNAEEECCAVHSVACSHMVPLWHVYVSYIRDTCMTNVLTL